LLKTAPASWRTPFHGFSTAPLSLGVGIEKMGKLHVELSLDIKAEFVKVDKVDNGYEEE
jgi:hypothetical protein